MVGAEGRSGDSHTKCELPKQSAFFAMRFSASLETLLSPRTRYDQLNHTLMAVHLIKAYLPLIALKSRLTTTIYFVVTLEKIKIQRNETLKWLLKSGQR